MKLDIRFRSVANQWLFNVFIVMAVAIVAAEIIICSFVRNVYIERVRSHANDYAQEFSVLAMVPSENFYSTARSYVEGFEHKDKVSIEIIDTYGNVFASTTGFLPDGEQKMQDYELALSSTDGYADYQTRTDHNERIMSGTILFADYGKGSNGAVRWSISLENTYDRVRNVCLLVILAGVLVLGLITVTGMYFVRSIVRPIRDVSSAARKIAMGDFENHIEIKKENEIGELCHSINYMAEELSRAENMKNDFISSVSHELRTPLTAIRGWGETAKMSIGTDEEIVKKGLDVVLKESERLSSLVEELLDFSRMQSGKLSVNLQEIDVSELLCEVADMYTELAHQQNVSLTYVIPRNNSFIMGDKDRLKQVFINVIDNAVKYTEKGGQVLVEQAEIDGCVQVTVKDTGVGIPAQDIDRVKEKFFKSNKTVRGSGIGLAVADEIIKQHNGLLFIQSTEGVGTTVTIALPLNLPETPEEPEVPLNDNIEEGTIENSEE